MGWYLEGGQKYNVAMHEELASWCAEFRAVPSFTDLAHFYTTEFDWGKHVVSVRTAKCLDIDKCYWLKKQTRIPVIEWQNVLHVEDPFNIGRNLNCVLNPGSSDKFRSTLVLAAENYK